MFIEILINGTFKIMRNDDKVISDLIRAIATYPIIFPGRAIFFSPICGVNKHEILYGDVSIHPCRRMSRNSPVRSPTTAHTSAGEQEHRDARSRWARLLTKGRHRAEKEASNRKVDASRRRQARSKPAHLPAA